VIRNLMYQVDTAERATGGIIVTSSRFTKNAVVEAKLHEWRLSLVNGQQVVDWLKRHSNSHISESTGRRRADRLTDTANGVRILDTLQSSAIFIRMKVSPIPCPSCGSTQVCAIFHSSLSDQAKSICFHLCVFCLNSEVREVDQPGWVIYRNTGCPICWRDSEIGSFK